MNRKIQISLYKVESILSLFKESNKQDDEYQKTKNARVAESDTVIHMPSSKVNPNP